MNVESVGVGRKHSGFVWEGFGCMRVTSPSSSDKQPYTLTVKAAYYDLYWFLVLSGDLYGL